MTLTPEQQYQQSWLERQDYADRMQPIIGSLYRNHGIEICIYGRPLVSASTIEIIKAHKTVTKYEGQKLRLRESFEFLEIISKMNLKPAKIDLGKLAFRNLYKSSGEGLSKEENKKCFIKSIQKFVIRKFNVDLAQDLSLRPGKHKIFAQFVISKTGEVHEIKIKAPHHKLKKEVKNIIEKLPKFTPGMQRKVPVNVKFTLPITFKVE